MKEIKGNLWEIEADFTCITTNGDIRKDGKAVMGRGCALEAATKWKDVPELLGARLKNGKISVTYLGRYRDNDKSYRLVAFPVKYHWKEPADIELIKKSAEELVVLLSGLNFGKVVLPRPGCGNGKLKWTDVKPVLETILDDRFMIVSWDS